MHFDQIGTPISGSVCRYCPCLSEKSQTGKTEENFPTLLVSLFAFYFGNHIINVIIGTFHFLALLCF